MVLVEQGDVDGAKNQLVEVLCLNPNDDKAWVVLGNLYVHAAKDLVTADKFLRRALAVTPKNPWALNGLATIAAKHGSMDYAVKLFEQDIPAEPEQTILPAVPGSSFPP